MPEQFWHSTGICSQKRPMATHPSPRPHECDRCGGTHAKCLAHNRAGKPCNRGCVDGADVCHNHGGAAPQVKRIADARVLTADIEAKLGQLGLDEWDNLTDPFSALARMAGKAERLEELLLEKVENLETMRSSAGQYGEQIDVVFAAYERAVMRLHAITKSMAAMDLMDKIASLQSRVDEKTAELVSVALSSALTASSVQSDVREQIMTAFGNALRQAELSAAG